MIRMLIVGYCYGIRFERRLCEEVKLHLAYRWFYRLDLDDKVPDHSTFSVNRHGRFRAGDILHHGFEAVVRACMDAGLVKGEDVAIDASVMEADASRYHGKTPDEIDWSAPARQTRAVAEFLAALDEDPNADRKPPKVISPVDPCSAWTAKAKKHEPGSDVGSATTMPIHRTRPSPAERPMRFMLSIESRRNWRRNRNQNPS
jgi:hypothetical protein